MKNVEDIDCAFPATLKEALKLLADEKKGARILAGGTDLMVQWASGTAPVPDRVVSVLALEELKGVHETRDELIIGAAVTHAELRRSPVVQRGLPALAAAAATIGGAQIQARGTIGGNVANASPAGDLAPSLLITGGRAVVASAGGEREVPLERFFTGYRTLDLQPGELIVRFVLPKLSAGYREGFRKLGPRAAQAISKVMGSWRGRVEDGAVTSMAVALGSVAPAPVRLRALEEWLAGRKLSEQTVAEAERRAADEVQPIDDIRSSAVYRRWASGRLVRWLLEQTQGQT